MINQCPRNSKTRLWGLIKYDGPHDLTIEGLSTKNGIVFRLHRKCRKCGVRDWQTLMYYEELIKAGLTETELGRVAISE